MELQGKVIAALPERSGVSSRGEWKSQDFVIETHESYPKKMVFSVFGADRLEKFGIKVGQEVLVSFDIDAREYKDRWFNSIRAFDVRLVDPSTIKAPEEAQAPEGPAAGQAPSSQVPPAGQAAGEAAADSDLPF